MRRPCLRAAPVVVFVLALLGPPSLAQAQKGPRLWVLQRPDAIVEYDAGTFATLRTVKGPPSVLERPEDLAINASGQLLAPLGDDKAWFWDGQVARTLAVPASEPGNPGAGVTDVSPHWFLSADGARLFVAENVFQKAVEAGLEHSVTTRFRLSQADLAGEHREAIAEVTFPPCQCGTGVCEETCPEAAVWAPDGGVDTFLFVTHWIPGQIGATYEASFLYRRSAAGWSPTKLPAPIERFLDAGRNGAVWIEAVPDGACCGWDNASSDQMVLERDGKKTVLFDEFQRYSNKDYDVSFSTPKARLAPAGRMIAFTMDGTAAPTAEIRLADEGRPDPAQLARIRAALADLPAVEVVDPDHPAAAPVARLHHAQLVGWLGDSEILIAEDGRLVAVDVSSKRRRESSIRVSSARDAFVVSPR